MSRPDGNCLREPKAAPATGVVHPALNFAYGPPVNKVARHRGYRYWTTPFVLILGLSISSAQANPDFQAIDVYLGAQIRDSHIPGLAVAIVKEGRIVHARGFGIARPDGKPVTPQTPFVLGSTSKSITAVAILQLVEAGLVELDLPVRAYLPWFSAADLAMSERMTVRHLLQHTSGFSTAAGREFLKGTDTSAEALEKSVRSLRAIRLKLPPGEQYQYSNINYIVLGMIVQEVSGQPFDDYVRTHIFQPLEMRNSFASRDEAQQHGLAAGHQMWFGYPVEAEGLPWSRDMVPAGDLISTAEDMAKFLAALMNNEEQERTALLPVARLEEMFQPGPSSRGDAHYGLGWMVKDFRGTRAAFHPGDLPEYHSNMLLLLDKDWGVIVLTNVNGYLFTRRMHRLAEGIGAMLLEEQPSPVEEPSSAWICYGAVAVLFVAQLLGVVGALRWLRNRTRREGVQRRWLYARVGLWLTCDIAIALSSLLGVPWFFETSLSIMFLYQPDITWGIVIFSTILILWGLIRTGLCLKTSR